MRWAASCPVDPVEDATGEAAGQGQPSDVWFLAGTYGDGRVTRRCTIPADRGVFVPVFNMWHLYADGPPPVVERAFATLDVDGVAQQPEVVLTPVPFVVAGVKGNPVTGKTKQVPVSVWGLWKHLPPFTVGSHDVSFRGGDGYGFEVSVDYHLAVVPG